MMKKTILLMLPFLIMSCFDEETDNASHEVVGIQSEPMLLSPAGEPIVDSVKIVEYCLPYPSERFLKWKNSDSLHLFYEENESQRLWEENEIYFYLKMHLDSVAPRKVLHEEKIWGPTLWEQKFDDGITYINIEYPEVGGGGELYTKCTDIKEFRNAIKPVIYYDVKDSTWYDPNMIWKDDSTKYLPFDEGVGCHYNIKKDSLGYYMMDWYCGC